MLLPLLKLRGPAASHCKPTSCTFCSVSCWRWADPNVHQSNLENPKIPFPRDVVVFPLHQSSWASFCLSSAVSTQPLENSMEETRRPSDSLWSEEAEGWQQRAFLPFPLCCPPKTSPWKFCCEQTLGPGTSFLSPDSNLTPCLA